MNYGSESIERGAERRQDGLGKQGLRAVFGDLRDDATAQGGFRCEKG
jgi:hypothetical protein